MPGLVPGIHVFLRGNLRRGWPGHAWTCPAMTPEGLPPKPFRLPRQFDGLDLVELDGALRHQIVDVAVGRTRDLHAVEIDLERAAVVLFGPGRGIAHTLHTSRHPVLLLIEALGDVLSADAAILGCPIQRFLCVECATDPGDIMDRAIHLAGRVGYLR